MNLKNIIESLLFVAEKPLNAKELADITKMSEKAVTEAVNSLKGDYKSRGLVILEKDGEYEIASSPQNSQYVAKLLNRELKNDLTQSALETLAIIMYKQPVIKSEIENIRGVNSDQTVRNLMIRGLVEEKGRKEAPGRPILYGTSIKLLKHFGFESEEEIPTQEEIND